MDDLTEIVDYISITLNNPAAARQLTDDVENAILKRLDDPCTFEPYCSKAPLKDVWYRIYVRNYTVFYVVQDSTMEVRRILYHRQNWTQIL